jgi:hypothetical protein
MKKFIFLLIPIILLISVRISAQESNTDFREKVYLGVKAGFNYANVYDSEGEEFKSNAKFGFVAGVYVAIPVWKYLGFQPGILFSQKGFNGTGRILGGAYEFTRTTNYIDIPLLLSIKPVDMLTLVIGPQYSYLLKQTDVFTNALTSVEQEQEFKNDNIRENTLCFLMGADVNVDQMVFGTRLGWDLMNNNGDGSSTTPRYKNAWWQLTFGYRFD